MLRVVAIKGRRNLYLRGTVKGQAVFETTGTSSTDHAEFICAQRNKELLDRHTFGPKATANFLEAAVSYLETHADRRFVPELADHFGETPLSRIGQAQADQAAAKLYPGRTAATLVRQVYTPLIAVLRYAAKSGLCDPPSITKPRIRRKAVEPADDQWIADLLDVASPRLGALVLFMTFTGARISEATRLTTADLDLRNGFAVLTETKNGRPRRVSLAPMVVAAIANIVPDQGKVFGYANKSGVYNALRATCKRAKIRYRPTHAFGRHAFAARLLASGATLKEVQEAGGWRSIRMPAETYGHLERSHVDEIVQSQQLFNIRAPRAHASKKN